ncbi:hypothetical protein T459_06670 [Capsicum annuum]|uniref:Protein Lines C-terminal domain-containing protein n=1 Tax=Capsicum annuum TaxID=4072 RepID=A0A1U8FZL6_CAPAN|nr:uncharacterized protein LOC107860343 isoform X2 [Capsicum annuum]PHT91557.1 hypothetical protein T459_06670 [Capsicum annuum]
MANEQSRLCGLIDHYLRPYTETESASLTKAMEKKLLIALSQVYTEIKGWMKEEESDDSFDMAGNSVEDRIIPGSHADHHHFSTKFIEVLMIVVATENPYIHHLVGNILVAVSEFLVESESCWGEYINLLYLCVKVSIFNGLSSMGHMMEVKDSSRDPSPSPLSKRSLKSASWPTAAVIMRVLHNVLKQLNRDLSDEFFNIYLEDTTSFISNMPWNLLSEVYHVHRDSNSDHLLQMQEAKPKSILVFQGYLLRLLCSSVKGGWTDAAVIASAEHPFIFEIKNLLPRLLSSCLSNEQHSDNVAICQYLKHKMLILMIRLSNQIHWDHSIIISWLGLIHTYFQDVLSQPMEGQEFGLDKYLEGSPFGVMTFDMGKKWISSEHLQRLSIFLFLKCASSLLNMKETTDQHYACKNRKSGSSFEMNPKCCSRRKALLELHEWLGEFLPGDSFIDHDMYSGKCMDFVSSFLQLYMQEDDILFEMLLQMLCLPFYSEKFTNEVALSDAEVREFSLISHLFHPIHFFHLFLSEIHYDHQVLLDYLISKDTGSNSAEYLLRCLRKVCDSWNIFVTFSWSGKCQSRKKKKFSTDDYNSEGEISIAPSCVSGDFLSRDSKRKKAYGCRHEDYVTQMSPFKCARNCLFQLKASIESLHQKNLFPYNPQVLLRRESINKALVRTYLFEIFQNTVHERTLSFAHFLFELFL